MNKIEKSRLGMHDGVKELLTVSTPITGSIPGFSSLQATYIGHITQCETAAKTDEFNSSGFVKTKQANKLILISLMLEYKSKLLAFAANAKNQILFSECSYTDSKIKKMDDSTIKSASMGLYDRLQNNLVAMAAYGITTTTQAAYLTAINAFIDSVPKIRTGSSGGVVNKSEFKSCLKILNADIKNIDIQLAILRNSQPSFYKKYRHIRILDKPKATPLSLRIKVTEFETDLPVQFAVIEITLIKENPNGTLVADNSFVSTTLIKKTKNKGNMYLSGLKSGMYKIVAHKNGLETYSNTIAVNDGERTDLHIILKKTTETK